MSTETLYQVTTAARLHLGFIDLREDAPRSFGSLGIALREPQCQMSLRPAEQLEVIAEHPAIIERLVQRFDTAQGVSSRCQIELRQSIPEHFGLGSGTQHALALGRLLCDLHKLSLSSAELATILQRGKRSGIGIAAFDGGGFILDGGKQQAESVPPVIAQLPFPEAWRIVLIFDHGVERGLHGASEKDAFQNLAKTPPPDPQYLSHLILMEMLPALVECDYAQFSAALGCFQRTMGDYFACFQRGRYSSKAVARIIRGLVDKGVEGVGQSSWGPTAYAIAQSPEHAKVIQAHIQDTITSAQAEMDVSRIEVLETSAKPLIQANSGA